MAGLEDHFAEEKLCDTRKSAAGAPHALRRPFATYNTPIEQIRRGPVRMISTIGHTLPHFQIVIAWLIVLASYLVFAIGRLPGTKIDRPAMAVIGAVSMFVFGVLTPKQAIESVDFATLVLLFSMMLIVASLHLSGFFEGVAHRVIEHLGAYVFSLLSPRHSRWTVAILDH